MSELSLSCDCGEVAGTVSDATPRTLNRLVCYCDDCQAFARVLGREANVLDPYGGTDIVQLTLPQVTISRGRERLRSLRLTPRGILRWHTECCSLPIANTVSASLPFVGLLRAFIDDDAAEEILGPPTFRIHGRFAHDPPAELGIHPKAPLSLLVRIVPRILVAKLRGGGRPSAFFDATGNPVVAPYIAEAANRTEPFASRRK